MLLRHWHGLVRVAREHLEGAHRGLPRASRIAHPHAGARHLSQGTPQQQLRESVRPILDRHFFAQAQALLVLLESRVNVVQLGP